MNKIEKEKVKTLSPREIEIMTYKAQGLTAKEIAKLIGLTYRTVEIYFRNIQKKLEAKNTFHALYIVLQRKMLKDVFI